MDTQSLIQNIVAEIKTVSGVKAIVLGGSRARGTHHAGSDIDLGIYYANHLGLDLPELAKVATKIDDEYRTQVITPICGWGPWINGGGWLRVQSMPVDFLYKDLDQINHVINDCLAGKVEMVYQPGHPFGFISSIYLAENAICQPLWDPEGCIANLKAKITPYPLALQKAIIQKFAWEVDFSLGIAKKGMAKADVAYVAGCCFRAVMCILQVLFALNKVHWLNEKGAMAIADAFLIKPTQFKSRVNDIFALLSATPETIGQAIILLKALNDDVSDLLRHNQG